jgi:transcriptional regulator with XRE-family HTH domain
MDLKTWIRTKKIQQRVLARTLGLSDSYLSELLSGKRNFNPKIAQKIEELTKGEVSRMELIFPESKPSNETWKFNPQEMLLDKGSPLSPQMREKVLSEE